MVNMDWIASIATCTIITLIVIGFVATCGKQSLGYTFTGWTPLVLYTSDSHEKVCTIIVFKDGKALLTAHSFNACMRKATWMCNIHVQCAYSVAI